MHRIKARVLADEDGVVDAGIARVGGDRGAKVDRDADDRKAAPERSWRRRIRRGISRRHGSHQVAQKLTMTGCPVQSASRCVTPARSASARSGSTMGMTRLGAAACGCGARAATAAGCKVARGRSSDASRRRQALRARRGRHRGSPAGLSSRAVGPKSAWCAKRRTQRPSYSPRLENCALLAAVACVKGDRRRPDDAEMFEERLIRRIIARHIRPQQDDAVQRAFAPPDQKKCSAPSPCRRRTSPRRNRAAPDGLRICGGDFVLQIIE
jgi:hypothetical protein